ncbi:hypothetical protein [Myxacorys almedinensis]|uniref:Uncharacterized protein n=1 Tax=Myxacorys almedinensis A TaxID=2690445 RepID=A0A8J8CJQ2_9CYAN|nr:hypothetical protein [Myxacorys almedinensis]NDJ19233.1 hypothetical protein [Myxacorys almedinensis A]
MTNLVKGTVEDRTAIAHAIDLLTHYSFDLDGHSAAQLLDRWLRDYAPGWIRWAVIEALYQGRYKAVSVEQILKLWQRRQQPLYHFSYEFERLVCHKFPRNLAQSIRRPAPPASGPIALPEAAILPALPAANPPLEVEPFKPPTWSALAEQMQHEELLHSPAIEQKPITAEPPDLPIAPRNSLSEVAEALPLRSVAQRQAGMDALIDQAATSVNASTEAGKTKVLMEEARHRIQAERSEKSEPDLPGAPNPADDAMSALGETKPVLPSDEAAIADDAHLPIHQFTPAADGSDFHSKLRAVADQDLRS